MADSSRAAVVAALRCEIERMGAGAALHENVVHGDEEPEECVEGASCGSHASNAYHVFGGSGSMRPGVSGLVSRAHSRSGALRKGRGAEKDSARSRGHEEWGASASSHSDEEAAMRKIERLCSCRERSVAELRSRLLRSGLDDRAVSGALDRATRCGLVSDERFADVLVRSRLSQGKGLAGISSELARNGIEPESVPAYQDAFESLDSGEEVSRAIALLERKPPRGKNVRGSAYRKLVQRGYSSSVASAASKAFSEAHIAR